MIGRQPDDGLGVARVLEGEVDLFEVVEKIIVHEDDALRGAGRPRRVLEHRGRWQCLGFVPQSGRRVVAVFNGEPPNALEVRRARHGHLGHIDGRPHGQRRGDACVAHDPVEPLDVRPGPRRERGTAVAPA